MTETDIKKLYKAIAADFKIITRKTELWTLDYCEEILYDIRVMLTNGFLDKISLILDKPKYTPFKVKQFKIGTTDRVVNERPGGNDWEKGDGDRLHVVLNYSSSWESKTNEDKVLFQRQNLKNNWVSTSINTNFTELQKTVTRKYSTGTHGIDRLDFN
ncbi:MAG: hypothetical protein P9L95_06440 [Candidatus Tenebribacter mawsonii]|nr:hypothetical protein [Candidatus Tenebribacter mawsonii]